LEFPRRGFCYWVRLPHEPQHKRRPALVISPDIRNQLANDVILIPISSHLRTAPTHVRLRPGEGGIPKSSMIKCEQITTVRKDRLEPKALGGSLSKTKIYEIEKSILRSIGVAIY